MSRRAILVPVLLTVGLALMGTLARLPASRGIAAQDAMSAATAWPRTGHPVIGAWQWDSDPAHPGRALTFALFDADGTYLEYDAYLGVGVGVWRATGARTAEVVGRYQHPEGEGGGVIPLAVCQPADIPDERAFEPAVATFWLSLVVDASATGMTATGGSDLQNCAGTPVSVDYGYTGLGQRLTVVPPASATPPAE